jgi:putative transcriptional regulator
LAVAASTFPDPDRIIRQDNRYSYDEDRYQLVGRIGKRLFVLVYTPRDGVIRIISARKANAREVRRYENRSYEDWCAEPLGQVIRPYWPQPVDATTEADIARHKAADDADAMLDAAKFARRVRRRLGLSQAEFADRIDVSLDTIRNWEQGKRSPTGAAKALLKILDKAPGAALAALH